MELTQAEIISLKPNNLLLMVLAEVALLCEPKITYLQLHSCFIDEDVCRLNITVNQSFFVNMLETTDQLLEEVENYLSVWLVIILVKMLTKGHTCAILHLNHDIESNKIISIVDQTVQ